jgi:hypothetical protein
MHLDHKIPWNTVSSHFAFIKEKDDPCIDKRPREMFKFGGFTISEAIMDDKIVFAYAWVVLCLHKGKGRPMHTQKQSYHP